MGGGLPLSPSYHLGGGDYPFPRHTLRRGKKIVIKFNPWLNYLRDDAKFEQNILQHSFISSEILFYFVWTSINNFNGQQYNVFLQSLGNVKKNKQSS